MALRDKAFFLAIFLIFLGLMDINMAQECDVHDPDKVQCGFVGTDQTHCESKGCCWNPVQHEGERDPPWCFYPIPDPSPCTDDSFNWDAADPGFTQTDYDNMYELFKSQLNMEDCGAVVVEPDTYYFHMVRDAGFAITAWLEINNNDYDIVKEKVDAYVGWVAKVQQKPSTSVDIRVEPKFWIPSGDPYAEGWCRPQTDGPALRAMALSKYGMILNGQGQDTTQIWDLVTFDLAWVMDNWASESCDLWEEVRSDDFYFNRMAHVYSLNTAADFADVIGQDGSDYRAKAEEIKLTAAAHWNGDEGYIYESENRPHDSAVIHSIATFGEYLYPPDSSEAASTISFLAKKFCQEYPINQEEIGAGLPGILFGRYPGGGNPWQLLTAVIAEVFYLGGTASLKLVEATGKDLVLDYEDNKAWMDLLQLAKGATVLDLAARQVSAGDAVMQRLHSHVLDTDGQVRRVGVQMDKNTGAQMSDTSLTWSYANILHALKVREGAAKMLNEFRMQK